MSSNKVVMPIGPRAFVIGWLLAMCGILLGAGGGRGQDDPTGPVEEFDRAFRHLGAKHLADPACALLHVRVEACRQFTSKLRGTVYAFDVIAVAQPMVAEGRRFHIPLNAYVYTTWREEGERLIVGATYVIAVSANGLFSEGSGGLIDAIKTQGIDDRVVRDAANAHHTKWLNGLRGDSLPAFVPGMRRARDSGLGITAGRSDGVQEPALHGFTVASIQELRKTKGSLVVVRAMRNTSEGPAGGFSRSAPIECRVMSVLFGSLAERSTVIVDHDSHFTRVASSPGAAGTRAELPSFLEPPHCYVLSIENGPVRPAVREVIRVMSLSDPTIERVRELVLDAKK